jgi:nucleotide-binding universal stress UspA family protein
MKRIMHATDFSPASRKAFKRALAEAKDHHAALTIVHVLSPVIGFVGDGSLAPSTYEALLRSTRAAAQKKLNALLASARSGRVRARGLLLEGVAHEQIVRAAKSYRADLLVVGTHGRTGVARFFVGSVAGRVVASARCPVLTVRGG